MSKMYLAWSDSGARTLISHADARAVHLLVAFPYRSTFLSRRPQMNVASWCLDSGAYTALNSGVSIPLVEYMAFAKDCDASEIFGLDIIGDHAASQRNCETMWAAGIPVIPTFHYGSPWSALKWCAQNSEKIALGGIARLHSKHKKAFITECFRMVWPKKIHGFACVASDVMETAPFHSVDASSWTIAPNAMGRWVGYTGKQAPLNVRGNKKDLWVEVCEYYRRADWAAYRWRRELALLEAKGAAA